MKKTLIATLIALVVPAAASAHDGWHHHHHHALYAKLSGSGTLTSAKGTIESEKLGAGTFTSSVTTTGAATTHTGDRGTVSCAPATAAVTLTGTSSKQLALTGRSCTWTATGSTTSTSMFFGKSTDAKAFLVAKSDGTVHGAVFVGVDTTMFRQFAAQRSHDCDGH